MEKLMTSEEVAEILHVDPVTIRRLVSKGELAAYRIGADYRFSPSDVEEYLQRQRIPAATGEQSDDSVPIDVLEQFILWIRNAAQGKRARPSDFFTRFDRFTERARRVLNLAQEEARRLQHHYIGTEHLLLGLVSEGQGVAALALKNLGVELEQVRSNVEAIIGRGDRIVQNVGEVGLTPRAKRVIELAVDEARRLSHHYIGTEHLLLGLIREGEGIGAQVLVGMSLNLEKLRTETLRVLSQMQRERTPAELKETASAEAEAEPPLTCSQCGRTSPATFRYCPDCGQQLIPEEPENVKEA